ncbi:isocitrate lyase/PEP mutase family protein [Thaumasiovibrio subtropicus]|uniref:isocitrate lyase/PEP mutase family protein n=1 Tax=Thaumasiovibrio subtropicus TaxID=1891207 RepID=UPI000B362D45|nr:isocitrate lyase/phosphoenolpyruvate mutase family protein [Thaumasiovibrio subtropicus]
MNFTAMHRQETPLILANVWDAVSARLAEKQGFQAIGTSSAAIAAMLGYPDGEVMPFAQYRFMVERIEHVTCLPLTVDIEAGYSRDPKNIARHINQLAELNVVGINIEDSIMTPSRRRQLLDADQFASLLEATQGYLSASAKQMFINVRTDVYVTQQPNAVEATIQRAQRYAQAGANGLFVPFIESLSDIEAVAKQCLLPLNVMAMPDLPDFTTLSQVGVKRISMGNRYFEAMYNDLDKRLENMVHAQSCHNYLAQR